MHVTTSATTLALSVTALKIILIYVEGYEKRNLIEILKDMRVIKFGIFDFVILDRYSLCRASILNLDRSLSIKTIVKR